MSTTSTPIVSVVHTRPNKVRVILSFAAIYTIWGSTYLAIRYGIETIPPFFLAGVRFTLAGLALYAYRRPRSVERPTKAQWRAAAYIGALLFLGGNGALVWAEQRVPSGLASLLVSTIPIWMVLITHSQHKAEHEKTRLGKRVLAGLAIGLMGIVLLIGPSQFLGHGGVDGVGAVVLLCGSLAWALGSIYSPRVGLPKSAMTAAAMQMICGGALLIFLGLATFEASGFRFSAISGRSFLAFLYLVTFGSLLAFTAYNWLLTHFSPARVSTYAYVNPVVAVFLGWAIGGEVITARTLTAAASVVAAVALIITHKEHVRVPTQPEEPAVAAPDEEETPPLVPLD